MSTEDLKQHATGQHDFYELLGVNYEVSESDIKRAYRKTSLKYHPDKNPGNLTVVEKFHLIGIARDVLLNPEAKALHDKTREARKLKQRQHDLMEGQRRRMKEDLERRESGFKRKREDEAQDEQKRVMEMRRLAEDGKRRRKEMEEKLRKKEEEEVSIVEDSQATSTPSQPRAPETERRVIVRFVKQGSLMYDDTEVAQKSTAKKVITDMFSRFGKIETVDLLPEKKIKLAGEKHKKYVARAAVLFGSAFSASTAVEDGTKLSGAIVDILPGPGGVKLENDPVSAPQTPSTPVSKPSFAKSFRSSIGSMNGMGASPSFSFSPMQNSPSNNEEATMLRLKAAQKAAERRRLEEQIRNEDAAES